MYQFISQENQCPHGKARQVLILLCKSSSECMFLNLKSEVLQKYCEVGEVIHQVKSGGLRFVLLHPIELCAVSNGKCLFISAVDKVKTFSD